MNGENLLIEEIANAEFQFLIAVKRKEKKDPISGLDIISCKKLYFSILDENMNTMDIKNEAHKHNFSGNNFLYLVD